MTEALFFVAGAVFTFFAVGLGVVGALAFQNVVCDDGKPTGRM